jgi:glycosyltransferase involved in cell wall biosynthesis
LAMAYGVMLRVTILIPALNEELALPRTIACLAAMIPPPDEILLVDGGSADRTAGLASEAGFRVHRSPKRGRGAQINYGVGQATGDVICVLHADTILPPDAIAVIRRTMANNRNRPCELHPADCGSCGHALGIDISQLDQDLVRTFARATAPLLSRCQAAFRRSCHVLPASAFSGSGRL